ncbi:MAG: sigma-70 family RNA polymerase sigma factor [Clostridia bacterium]|nr:sigma-70 family RNA polymerase sigma factor [Clostridia bacterium]MEE1024470.1 sigma-70 family RNA polymerase sigma factor [Acutalibacteraceae bacterium]
MLSFYLSLIDSDDDKSKFEMLYNNYKKRMIITANEILNNIDDAEDAVHTTFVALAKNIDHVPDPDSHDALLYVLKAAKNNALNYALARNKRAAMPSIDEEAVTVACWDQYLEDKSYDVVVDCIKNMEDIYKDALYYYYVCGLTVRKLASLIGISYKAAEKRIQRGRLLLQKELEKRGITG